MAGGGKSISPQSGHHAGIFTRFAHRISVYAGSGAAFVIAVSIVALWAVTGPLFGFSDTWQLVINTGTTIVTFLMVFLIQNTQNRDTQAMQLKLDELIRAHEGAHDALLDIEQLDDRELHQLHRKYTELAEKARRKLDQGSEDTDSPFVDLKSANAGE